MAGAGIGEEARALAQVAVLGDELKRVDVALVEPSERETAVADEPQDVGELPGPRLLAETAPAQVGRDRRREQSEADEVGDVGGRKTVVAILGLRTLPR